MREGLSLLDPSMLRLKIVKLMHVTIFCDSHDEGSGACHIPHYDSSLSHAIDLSYTANSAYRSYVLMNITLDSIADKGPSKTSTIYWKTGADNLIDNHDESGLVTHQDCYELCQEINEGACWIFRSV